MKIISTIMLCALAFSVSAATYTVNTLVDNPDDDIGDGDCDSTLGTLCTLRAAIQEANSDTTADTIVFDFSFGTGVLGVILSNGPLPTITQQLTIDGRTVPGYDDFTGDVRTSTPRMFIFGASTTGSADGLRFSGSGATNSAVYAMGIIDFPDNGIEIVNNASGIIMDANWIGLHWSDNSARANDTGINVQADFAVIGAGGIGGIGNLISGNTTQGITGFASNILIHDNQLGVAPNDSALPNGANAIEFIGGNATVTDNRIEHHSTAITIIGANATITDNMLSQNQDAILVTGNSAQINDNGILQNLGKGIQLGASDNSQIDGNVFAEVGEDAITVGGGAITSDNNDITNNLIATLDSGYGIYIEGGSNNLVESNRIVDADASGIRISGDNNYVADNKLGFFEDPSFILSPVQGNGIIVQGADNDIGLDRSATPKGNIIATGSATWMDGIDVWTGSSFNRIDHNYIGVLDSSGFGLGIGGMGVRVDNSPGTIIANNIIGLAENGIQIISTNQVNTICRNQIGVITETGGAIDIANRQIGILVDGNFTDIRDFPSSCGGGQGFNYIGNSITGIALRGNSNNVDDTYIGGTISGTSFPNDSHGLEISNGGANNNLITATIIGNAGDGVSLFADAGNGNSIAASTRIFGNLSGTGIDLNNDGASANDSGDTDTGPNALMNHPDVTLAVPVAGALEISYRLDYNMADTSSADVHFFLGETNDRQAEHFLGTDTYNQAPNSLKNVSFPNPGLAPDDYYLVTRAVDENNNSSEFSIPVLTEILGGDDVIFSNSFGD